MYKLTAGRIGNTQSPSVEREYLGTTAGVLFLLSLFLSTTSGGGVVNLFGVFMKRFAFALMGLFLLSSVANAQTLVRLSAKKSLDQRTRAVLVNGNNIVVTPAPLEDSDTYLTVGDQDFGLETTWTSTLNYNNPLYGLVYSYSYQYADARPTETKVYTSFRIQSNPNVGNTRDCYAEGFSWLLQGFSISGTSPSGDWNVPVRMYIRLWNPSVATWGAGDSYDQTAQVYADTDNNLKVVYEPSNFKWRVTGKVSGVTQNYLVLNSGSSTTTIEKFGTSIISGDTPFSHTATVNSSNGISQGGVVPGGYRQERIRTWASLRINGAIVATP